MKRKILVALLALVSASSCAFGLAACEKVSLTQPKEGWGTVFTVETAYAEAQSLGYSGKLEDFLASIQGRDGQPGSDGVGISQVFLNENGELIVVLTNETEHNIGSVVGKSGRDGVSVIGAAIDENGVLAFTLSDGSVIPVGNIKGGTGAEGKPGQDGVGISSASINASGELVVTYTDDSTANLGVVVGTDGRDGVDGISVTGTAIDENGSLVLTFSNGNSVTVGNVVGKDGIDGLSAYEIYVKYHPNYEGSEENWIRDLISGQLKYGTANIDYIPAFNLTVAAGEEIVLPQEVNVYFEDGDVESYPVVWPAAPSSSLIGVKTIHGTIAQLNADVVCNIQITNYSSAEKYIDGYVNGILGNDEVLITVYNDTYLKTTKLSSDGYFCFDNLENGTYYIKIDAAGYQASDIQMIGLSDVTVDPNSLYANIAHVYFDLVAVRTPGYYFVWNRTDMIGNTETTANINSKIVVEFLEDTQYVSDIGDASYLRDKYNVVLSDSEVAWSTETSARFLELYARLPWGVTEDLKSVWVLTKSHLQNDIEFTEQDGVYYVTVSIDAIQNMTPRVAVSDGVTGRYFSNRFYNALIRFATNNGTNADKCERILNENFLTSFNVPDYSVLTAGITDEDASRFQEFYPEEKLLILTMFEEMPTGMHKMTELKYLVRRKTGTSHPLYPDAAAVTWPYAAQPYIEFMDVTFSGKQGYYETKRLIIHEKTHMFWAYYFSDELKAQWCEVGGWYQNPDDIDGWSTTKQTEFVSAYAHAHNPDEDMAESVATYVINPDLLRSRAPAKYEFIKNYIMGGSFYLTQIREDLTFEVYNLNPDYTYPGQIDRIAIKVEGGLYEDKTLSVEIVLHGTDEFEGASGASFRLLPGDNSVNQFYDVGLGKVDDLGLVLRGSITMSKYSYSGYWFTDQIVISDSVGNQRYESNADFSLKVFLDNPLYDAVRPELVRGSLQLSLVNADNPEHPDAQYLVIKFNFIENVYLDRTLVRLYCQSATKDSIDTYAKDYEINRETGEVTMYVYIPEHYSSGIYEISQISLWDRAGNYGFYHIAYGTLVDENNTILITTTNPDDNGPVLDVNDITVSAVPSIPEQPNGETFVTITIKVHDDISGVQWGYIRFIDPQGITHGYWINFPNYSQHYFSGDPTEEITYTFTFTLPKGSAPGTWGIYEISLTDCALNTSVYNFAEIVHFEIS